MSGNVIQLNEDLIKNNLKDLVRDSVEETLNALLDHEADELVRVGKYERNGAFPDGNSALMLVCAKLRHVAASEWGSKRYMDMEHLFKMEIE